MKLDNSTTLAVITTIEHQLDILNEDYVIVNRASFSDLLRHAPPEVIANVMKELRAEFPESIDGIRVDSPRIHVEIRRLRKLSGISQKKLALKAGLTQPDISAFETHGPNGFTNRVQRIHDALRALLGEQTLSA